MMLRSQLQKAMFSWEAPRYGNVRHGEVDHCIQAQANERARGSQQEESGKALKVDES